MDEDTSFTDALKAAMRSPIEPISITAINNSGILYIPSSNKNSTMVTRHPYASGIEVEGPEPVTIPAKHLMFDDIGKRVTFSEGTTTIEGPLRSYEINDHIIKIRVGSKEDPTEYVGNLDDEITLGGKL